MVFILNFSHYHVHLISFDNIAFYMTVFAVLLLLSCLIYCNQSFQNTTLIIINALTINTTSLGTHLSFAASTNAYESNSLSCSGNGVLITSNRTTYQNDTCNTDESIKTNYSHQKCSTSLLPTDIPNIWQSSAYPLWDKIFVSALIWHTQKLKSTIRTLWWCWLWAYYLW